MQSYISGPSLSFREEEAIVFIAHAFLQREALVMLASAVPLDRGGKSTGLCIQIKLPFRILDLV